MFTSVLPIIAYRRKPPRVPLKNDSEASGERFQSFAVQLELLVRSSQASARPAINVAFEESEQFCAMFGSERSINATDTILDILPFFLLIGVQRTVA